MKISRAIQNCYDSQRVKNEKLKTNIDTLFKNNIKYLWHYESRIKSEQSFSLKIETGRFYDPNNLEDFFACTIVVKNYNEIEEGVKFIKQYCEVSHQRPENKRDVLYSSDKFPFDDLRLYVKLKDYEQTPEFNLIKDIIFEIQIKTYLQHAWAIAIHDLIYKTDDINWAKQRIAFQTKAMLEQAEITISGVEHLTQLRELDKEDEFTQRLKEIKALIVEFWQVEQLPKDLVRLSRNIYKLMQATSIDVKELRQIIIEENSKGRGSQTLNLSPYQSIIQSIIHTSPSKLDIFLNGTDSNFKIFISEDLELNGLNIDDSKNCVKISHC